MFEGTVGDNLRMGLGEEVESDKASSESLQQAVRPMGCQPAGPLALGPIAEGRARSNPACAFSA